MSSLGDLLDILLETKSFRKVLDHLEKKEAGPKNLRLGNLYGSSKSFVAAGLCHARPGSVLLVTRGAKQAEKIEADLVNFLDGSLVSLYPQWEVLPYEEAVEDREIIGRRVEILSALLHRQPGITVVPVKSLMQKVLAPESFCEKVLTLRAGSEAELDLVVRDLAGMGFTREAMVEEVGTFALRGGILDIYGYRMENPVRVEFDGDLIAEMRSFEISTQRSVKRLEEAVVLPVAEPFGWRRDEPAEKSSLKGFFEYLDSDTLILFDEYESVVEEARRFHDDLADFYRRAVKRGGAVFHPPDELFLAPDELLEHFAGLDRADLCSLHRGAAPQEDLVAVRFDTREPPAVNRDIDRLRTSLSLDFGRQRKSYILCDTPGQLERLEELLEESDEMAHLCLGSLETGFVYREAGLVIYTDHEIFRRFRHVRSRGRYQRAPSLESFSSLTGGDYVVHIDYGIGRYRGLKKIHTENYSVECLWLEYADGEFLYVPIDQLSLVERYSSEDGAVPSVHKIGGVQWARMKARTVKAIEDMTGELIEIYAERKVHGGYAFPPDTDWQRELERSFVYEETRDQSRAITEIKCDMEAGSCMDRLLCGDVGFGKTEVALRAAFKVVQDGKQVAILVPTTVLAQQHYITFSERLADFPVAVETLSRFKSPREQKEILRRLESGSLDIIIGTHRLLSRDVKFKDLGFLVIDEEQRFGVRQKERLKSLKRQVDTLAMTATPIPRTLHMSLMSIRDLSLITTPPQDRLPIITQVCAFDNEVIAEAVRRELARDGQVFFVHNRIGSIYSMLSFLRRLVPGARVGVAHGQMPERDLEAAMRRFQNREIDVLLSTMIIENGLDFPNANTIIVNRADCFGLSQLYQLRGRVGRSYHRAYAYLLVPPLRLVTDDAVKRLRVLEEYTELGSGYEIAMHDLEMRGTGNLLGSQQHGFINAVGFDTYLKLLKEAISKLKNEQPAADIAPARITLDLPAFLPDSYVPDQKQKLSLYRKISALTGPEKLDEVAVELADRYGPLPEEALSLLDKTRLKIYASALGMEALFISDSYCKLDFGRKVKYHLAPITMILQKVEGEKKVASLTPPSILIKPGSKHRALGQVISALAEMFGRSGEIIGDPSGETGRAAGVDPAGSDRDR
ncbi:MAG: transcription-repair coupling factor [Candidatus Glassbacteria bacterium]|nr:transcription-repair coupling factor [Candidatus Glassbacteria bacterium]